jgi:signal transduction histidine kinase
LIEVTDTGPGIPAEHRGRIFDRFYRVERDRSSQAGGTGLGLSIAKWAAEANGGRIELDTQEKQGSTFRLVLPKSVQKR